MYIVLEGIDGAGKSTQISLLKDFLEQNGLEVETVVEPTDSEVGKLIRKLLTRHDATSDAMQRTLGLLFAADRLLIMEKLNKLEEEGKVIISDRSFYSSLVYQEPREWIQELNKYAKIPDLVLLLDLDVEKSVARTDGTDVCLQMGTPVSASTGASCRELCLPGSAEQQRPVFCEPAREAERGLAQGCGRYQQANACDGR